VKKELPLLIGFLAGAFALAEFYIPAAEARMVQKMLLEWASVLAAAAFVLGGINVIQVNVPIIRRRRPDWPYKLVLIGGALIMLVAGIRWDTFGSQPEAAELAIAPGPTAIGVLANRDDAVASIDGQPYAPVAGGLRREVAPGAHTVAVHVTKTGFSEVAPLTVTVGEGQEVTVRAHLRMLWGPSGRVYTWLYDHLFSPCNATMFALLAFFIASAAFRAFRARNVEAALLLGSAILIMLGRVPLGRAISGWLPWISDWIIDIPNNAGRRAIMMGAALGAIATSLRVILGLERSHLGRD
jgi:hypothetical protein